MWRWGLEFIRNCGVERYRKAVGVNLRLANHTLSLMDAVREDTGVQYDLMQKGTLKIYTRQEALDKNVAESERQRAFGLIFEQVDAKRCVEIEPALAPIEHDAGRRHLRAAGRARRLPQVRGRAAQALRREARRDVPLQHARSSGSCAPATA